MTQPIYVAHWLRDILIDHMLAGGRQPYNHAPNTKARRDHFSMISSGHLELIDGNVTEITYKGRSVLAYVLADYADCLVRAGVADVAEDRSRGVTIRQGEQPMRGIGQVPGVSRPHGRPAITADI